MKKVFYLTWLILVVATSNFYSQDSNSGQHSLSWNFPPLQMYKQRQVLYQLIPDYAFQKGSIMFGINQSLAFRSYQDSKWNNMGFSLFGRYYFESNKLFKPFVQAGITGSYSNLDHNYVGDALHKSGSFDFGLGLAYPINSRFSLECTLLKSFGLSYSKSDYNYSAISVTNGLSFIDNGVMRLGVRMNLNR